MNDPKPENITGEKVRKHTFSWEVNVGHVVIGAAVIYVVWKVGRLLSDGSSGSQEERSFGEGSGVDRVDGEEWMGVTIE